MKNFSGLAVCLCLISIASCDKHHAPAEPGGVDFSGEIKPLLTANCLPCHHSETLLGGLNLESRKSAFGGREGGAFLVPGEPDSSLIYRVTEDPHGKGALGLEKMPAMKGVNLTEAERDLLRQWITEGAKWPGGNEGWLKPIKIEGTES